MLNLQITKLLLNKQKINLLNKEPNIIKEYNLKIYKPKIGFLFISSTKNNTFVSINTQNKNTMFTYSLGQANKINKNGNITLHTFFNEYFSLFLLKNNIRKIKILFKGGSNTLRRQLIKNLTTYSIQILSLKDYSKTPHNGCKLKTQKRGKYFSSSYKSLKKFF
jgi:ribosomal protein S11